MSSNPPPPCSHFRPGAVPVTCATCGQEQRFHNPLPPAGLSRDDLVVALERLAAAGCIMGRAVGCDLRTESACIYCVAKESLAALRALPAAPRPDAGEAPDYKTALKTALAAALTPSAPALAITPPCSACVSECGKPDPACPYCHGSGVDTPWAPAAPGTPPDGDTR